MLKGQERRHTNAQALTPQVRRVGRILGSLYILCTVALGAKVSIIVYTEACFCSGSVNMTATSGLLDYCL